MVNHRVTFVVGLALVAVGFVAFKAYEHLYETIPDLYAQEWVAGIVITHMDLNEGRWPRDWDDLEKAFKSKTPTAGRPWTFEELRNRVDVDFAADPNELSKTSMKNGSVPFHVISLRSGKKHHWEGGEPNVRIWIYLRERARRAEKERAVSATRRI